MKLKCELNEPRPACLGDFAKRCIETVSVWIQKLGVIESVEEFSAKFQEFRLSNGRSFQKRDIPIVNAWAAQSILPRLPNEASDPGAR